MEHKEYYAFISYKREDEEWAKWLAHKLEHYNLPTTLNGKELPKNLRPVFRDTDELSAGNLPKQIYHALSISKNLIVVCSPRSAQSEWVNKEITDFIDIKGGNSENIFPFIIDGIPHSKDSNNECFPKTLRCLPGDEERLGGNINDQGGREAAVVKIISGMLGVSFDSLWHKHEREQKRKRIAFIIASLLFAFVCLIVGGYIAFQNIELDVAKKEISKQRDIAIKEKERAERVNASLVIANDSIKIQKDKVSAINDELLKTNQLLTIERDKVLKSNRNLKLSNAIIRSENALALMRNGNLLKAKNVLKEICTDDDATKLVKQSEVEYALRTVHREWEKDGFKSRFTLEEIGDISFAKFDETGNNLYVCVNDTSVLSVDAKSGLIYNVHNLSLSHDTELVSYDFDNVKGNIFYTIDNSVYITNIYTNNSYSISFQDEIDHLIVSPKFNFMVCCNKIKKRNTNSIIYNGKYHLINLNNHILSSEVIPNCDEVYSFSSDGNKIICRIGENLCIYNLINRNIESQIKTYCSDIFKAYFTCDNSYVLINYMGEPIVDSLDTKYTSRIDIYSVSKNDFVDLGHPIHLDDASYINSDINPQMNRIVGGDNEGNLVVYDLGFLPYFSQIKDKIRVSGRILETKSFANAKLADIVFNRDGTQMFTRTHNKLSVWDVTVRDGLTEIQREFDLIAKSGKSYLKVVDGLVQLYDTSLRTPIGFPLYYTNDRLNHRQIRISSNNETVVTCHDSLLYVINPFSKQYFTIPVSSNPQNLKFSINKDGSILAIGDEDKGTDGYSLTIFDVTQNKILSKVDMRYRCTSIDLNPYRADIVVGSGSDIVIYDVKNLSVKHNLPNKYGFASSLCYSPNGEFIVSAHTNGTVCLWNANDGNLVKSFYAGDVWPSNCSVSADCKYLIVTVYDFANLHKNYIWNIESGKIVEIIESENCYLFCQDVLNKMYSLYGETFERFPTIEELINFYKE